jgi:hypothetical protein
MVEGISVSINAMIAYCGTPLPLYDINKVEELYKKGGEGAVLLR